MIREIDHSNIHPLRVTGRWSSFIPTLSTIYHRRNIELDTGSLDRRCRTSGLHINRLTVILPCPSSTFLDVPISHLQPPTIARYCVFLALSVHFTDFCIQTQSELRNILIHGCLLYFRYQSFEASNIQDLPGLEVGQSLDRA
jgi:hypothetical protein